MVGIITLILVNLPHTDDLALGLTAGVLCLLWVELLKLRSTRSSVSSARWPRSSGG